MRPTTLLHMISKIFLALSPVEVAMSSQILDLENKNHSTVDFTIKSSIKHRYLYQISSQE